VWGRTGEQLACWPTDLGTIGRRGVRLLHHTAEEGKSGGGPFWVNGGLVDGGTGMEVRL